MNLIPVLLLSRAFLMLWQGGDINFLLSLPLAFLFEAAILRFVTNFKCKGFCFTIIYALVLLHSLVIVTDFLVNGVYVGSSRFFFAITLFGAVIYAIFLGYKGVVRAGNVIFIIFLFSFLFSVFGNITQMDLSFISGNPDIDSVMRYTALNVIFTPEILLLSRGEMKKGYLYLLFANLLIGAMNLVTLLVLGGVNVSFPYYMVATMAKISVFGRLDAVHTSVWVMMAFIRSAIFGGKLRNEN